MRIAMFLGIIMLNNIANAGAWMLKPNESQIIFQNEYKILTSLYTDPTNNQRYPSKSFRFMLYNLFYQYGWSENLNLGIQAKWFNYYGYDQIYSQDNDSSDYDFFEASEFYLDMDYKDKENKPTEIKFFAQTPLWQDEQSIISIQPNITLYNNAQHHSAGVALLYGRNFQIGIKTGFINLEAGIDARRDSSTKFDITLGYYVTSRHMLMAQLLNRKNSRFYEDNFSEATHSRDLRLSYIYKYNKSLSIETGYSRDIMGQKSYRSESIVAGVSIKF